MKFKFLTLAALTGILLSCTESYKIEGTWEKGVGKTVYLKKAIDENRTEVIDSVVVADNGTFSFSLPPQIDVYQVSAADRTKKYVLVSDIPAILDVRTTVRTRKDSTTYDILTIVSSGDEQVAYEKGNDLQMSAAFMQFGRMMMYSRIINGEDTSMSLDSAAHMFDLMDAEVKASVNNYLDSAKNNYGVTYFIKDYLIKNESLERVQAAYDALSDRVKQSAPGLELKAAVEALASVTVGGMAPDIKMATPEGEELSLHSLRGHYVLLDFWASWCGPCLREVPNVKSIYEKYHDKGFEVFGVSLDETEAPWKAAIEKHEMNWYHVSSLKGWSCPAVKQYNVTGIPRMYIIDPEGKIIAQDLRGEELAAFVAGLYE